MTRLVARIKILPAEAESDLDRVVGLLKEKIPQDMDLKSYAKEPLAFGLHFLIADFTLDDKEGQMDKLEEVIKGTDGVGEIQVINISRQSVKMK